MEASKAYRLLAGNPDRRRPLGKPFSKCVDIIKMDLVEMGWWGELTRLICFKKEQL
jgi:hypothetical protein